MVCKAWRVKLDDVAFRRDVFQQKWGLTKLVGAPKKPAFYLVCVLCVGCTCNRPPGNIPDWSSKYTPVCRKLTIRPL